MKKKYEFCLSMALVLTAFLLAMSGIRKNEEALASRIAPEILRFHVLANSDSAEDQAIKLEVKDLLLREIRERVESEARVLDGQGLQETGLAETGAQAMTETNLDVSRGALESYIRSHAEELEDIAENYMAQRGFPYPAEIRLETCEFPQKTYGDMTFPAGTYDAVRVLLGAGEGQNFWCVLYPSLCYLDSTYAVVPDSSKETLKNLILEDDFQALLSTRNASLSRPRIRFKLLDLFH